MALSSRRVEARRRIEEFLSSSDMIELLKPNEDDEQELVGEDIPDGPWSLAGWILSFDVTSFVGVEDGVKTDQPETWSVSLRGKGTLSSQAKGLAYHALNGL